MNHKHLNPLLFCLFIFLAITMPAGAQKYASIDNEAKSVKYKGDIRDLALRLTNSYTEDEQKARAIFAWLAHNISYDFNKMEQLISGKQRNQIRARSKKEYEEKRAKQLKTQMIKAIGNKKGVCEDFSYLFKAMADEIGLESAFVTGYSKNSPKTMTKRTERGMHAWNAVKIDGSWELIDVTWSTGIALGENFGDGYFLIEPSIFAISHHPDTIEWQLMEEKVTYDEFLNYPFMYPSFFNYPIQNFKPKHAKLSKSDELLIEVHLNPGQSLAIFKSQKPTKFKFTQRSENEYFIDVSKIKTRGILDIVMVDKGSVTPLLAFRR